ncbi:hypothetical protein PLESTB_000036300 [Pleodorina starrii]|uniref:Protein kinase domain-containing protein n=1 Tax=Pleodorina starrii TaxID=330485 RepID=A0A9W6B9X6_9CHLO|nr:hypothetical protein PLESTB_000036300 [Pleodorina starrii]GLC70684.1 hypothetical protein PLESTF_001022200 [Pleodorina starrii]
MEFQVRTFVDFDHDATINPSTLSDFRYVSKGGFALVFVANLRRSNGVIQQVAIKVLKPDNHFRPANYSKFLQEVALQTALPHPFIVQALGFCSIPVSQLLAAAPPEVLVPNAAAEGGGGGGRKAAAAASASAQAWFSQQRLHKCWALVMELMPDGNMFDQVLTAARSGGGPGGPGTASRLGGGQQQQQTTAAAAAAAAGGGGSGGGPGPGPGLGGYSDAQALLWLIDVADAMTFLHSREQPLLIHRDLKLENVLLRRDADGLLRAKLSDFGLAAVVDAGGRKVPPPQILRAPGQSLQDVCAFTPLATTTTTTTAAKMTAATAPAKMMAAWAKWPLGLGRAAGVPANGVPPPPPLTPPAPPEVQPPSEPASVLHTAGKTPDRTLPSSQKRLNPNSEPNLNLASNPNPTQPNPFGHHYNFHHHQQQHQQHQQRLPQRAQSSSQVLVQATAVPVLAAPQGQGRAQGRRQGMTGDRRPWSAAQVHLQGLEEGEEEEEEAGAAAARRGLGQQMPAEQQQQAAAGSGSAVEQQQQQQQQQRMQQAPKGGGGGARRAGEQGASEGDFPSLVLQPQRSAISWTAAPRRGGGGGGGGAAAVGCGGRGDGADAGGMACVGPHGLQPAAMGRSQVQGGGAPLAGCRASSSRLSETGHAQVKMEQLTGLLRLGMGHRDYLPDMYQMNFKLTSQCGSVCYMAPEVARQLPYNQKADVFSFGCIMFEVMTRQLLSDSIPEGDMDAAVEYLSRVSWAGWRPDLPPSLPKELRLLISLCWHREPRLRPSFPTIATRLREVLLATAAVPSRASKSSLVAAAPPPPGPQLQQQQEQQQHQQRQQQQQRLVQLQQQQMRLHQHIQRLQLPVYWPGDSASTHQPMATQAHIMHGAANAARNGFEPSAFPAVGSGAPLTPAVSGGAHTAAATHTATAAAVAAAIAAATQTRQQLAAQHQHQQQQLQLQLQLQQLNACTARLGAAAAAHGGAAGALSSYTSKTGGDASPYTVYSAGSRLPSLVESAGTYTAATGGRISSPVLGTLGVPAPAGRGGLLLDAATMQPGRATATAILNSDGGCRSPVSSPVSPSGSRGGTRRLSGGQGLGLVSGPGQEARASGGTASKSEGSAGTASGASFRSPREQQLLAGAAEPSHPQAKGQEGCMSLCALM